MFTRTAIRLAGPLLVATVAVALTAGCTGVQVNGNNLDSVAKHSAEVTVGTVKTTLKSGSTVNAEAGKLTKIKLKDTTITVHCADATAKVDLFGDKGTVTFDADCGDVELGGTRYTAKLRNAADLNIVGIDLTLTAAKVKKVELTGSETKLSAASATDLDITGGTSTIDLGAVQSISIVGAGNTVTYGGQLTTPAVITGVGNTVNKK